MTQISFNFLIFYENLLAVMSNKNGHKKSQQYSKTISVISDSHVLNEFTPMGQQQVLVTLWLVAKWQRRIHAP